MVRAAIIDDDSDFTELMSDVLRDHGWEVIECHRETDAYLCVEREQPDVVLLDLRMEADDSGWKILERLEASKPTAHIPVIICSAARDDLNRRADWLEERSLLVLHKPFDLNDLYRLLAAAAGVAHPPGQEVEGTRHVTHPVR